MNLDQEWRKSKNVFVCACVCVCVRVCVHSRYPWKNLAASWFAASRLATAAVWGNGVFFAESITLCNSSVKCRALSVELDCM